MPKIIKNIREQLLAETRAQVERQGYGSTTIRSVANARGIAVGTVYNYFPSKDLMIASYMEEDWKQSLAKMKARCGESAEAFLRRVYNGLKRFMRQHKSLFSDKEAKQSYAAAFPLYHGRLRRQIASLILPLCHEKEERDRKYLAAFIAESVITWAQAGTPFDTLYGVLKKLIREDNDHEQL